jgi:hypothetical protein
MRSRRSRRGWSRSPRSSSAPWFACLLVSLLLASSAAHAYNEEIHALLGERAFAAELRQTPLVPASAADVARLRTEIWQVGSTHPDARVRDAFLARWPTLQSFDDWAFKEMLGLNPDKTILGIDTVPDLGSPLTVGAAVTRGSRHPDDDGRNRDRFAHDDRRQVRKDPFGREVPADPAQLDMGSLKGTSSQAWAHYGLPKAQWSSDPDVLKSEPQRWSYKPDPQAFAAHFAQMHTDLAICATTLGTEGGPTLGWLYLGNAHHYIEDVANQIHTLQAIYDFFFDAKVESWKEEARSLGGLLRSRPRFVTIGVQIITNHHLLAENLFAKRVREATAAGGTAPPLVGAALQAIERGDGALEQALDARRFGPDDEFARAIAEEVIEASSREGADVYRLIRELVKKEMSRVGGKYVEGSDPDGYLRKHPDAQTLERFYRLQGAGFARAGSALRRHVLLYRAAVDPARTDDARRRARFEASARRLVANQMSFLAAGDARLAKYVPEPPEKESINWWVPGGAVAVLMLIAGLVVWIRRRRRSRRTPE